MLEHLLYSDKLYACFITRLHLSVGMMPVGVLYQYTIHNTLRCRMDVIARLARVYIA